MITFRQAAAKASMSRFYGGIHYVGNIVNGNKQGMQVANNITGKIKKAGIMPMSE